MRKAKTILLGGLIALATLAIAVPGARAADDDLVKQVEAARTPADHEAIAARYDALAKEAKDEAAMHRAMAKQYQQGPNAKGNLGTTATSMAKHCENLARNFDAQAKEFEAIAKAHRQLAAKTR